MVRRASEAWRVRANRGTRRAPTSTSSPKSSSGIVIYHEPSEVLAGYLGDRAFGVHLVGNANGTGAIMAALHSAAAVARAL